MWVLVPIGLIVALALALDPWLAPPDDVQRLLNERRTRAHEWIGRDT